MKTIEEQAIHYTDTLLETDYTDKDIIQAFCHGYMAKNASSEHNEEVSHPARYNQYPREVIDMMVDVFGKEKTADFCLINAFKYRMRLGHKDNIQQDFEKEQWYLNKYKEFTE